MKLFTDDNVDQFLAQSMVQIDLSNHVITEVVTERLMPAMELFWEEPQEFKNQFQYDWDKKRKTFDTGYVKRNDDEDKEFFHNKETLANHLKISRVGGELLQIHPKIVPTGNLVRNIGVGIITSLAYAIDRRAKDWRLADRMLHPFAIEEHTLRSLHYKGMAQIPGMIAKEHTDIKGITLVIHETHKGVMAGDVMLCPGFVFAGDQLQEISGQIVPAKPHGVVEQRIEDRGHNPERREECKRRQSTVLFGAMFTQSTF